MRNAQQQADRGRPLLEAARRSIERGRLIAGRALLDAARTAAADPDDNDSLDDLDMRLMLTEGRTEDALRLAGQAIARAPDNWRPRCTRAEIRLSLRDATGAASDAAEAVVAAPREPAPKAALGSALLVLGHVADARACLAEAVAGNPGHIGYRLAFARALSCLGETGAARATLDEAIALRPTALALRIAAARLAVSLRDFTGVLALAEDATRAGVFDACLLGLRGHALSSLDRHEEAAGAYRDALQLAPEDSYVRHLVAASGLIATPNRASPDYVRVLFDGFADHFENDLIRLDYRIPGLIRQALLAHAPLAPNAPSPGPVLDLGCGTGLVALVLSDLNTGPFTGIDLSPAMLAKAAAKGLYDQLIEGDVCTDLPELAGPPGRFGLAVAADVLPYLGDPAPVLEAVRAQLRPGSLFLLTIEALPDTDIVPYRLGGRARYAHRPDALRAAAEAAGFAMRDCRAASLRHDQDSPVHGCVMVLERRAEPEFP